MFHSVKRSLADYLPCEYANSLIESAVYTKGLSKEEAASILNEKVDFYSADYEANVESKLCDVGKVVITPIENPLPGCSTNAFNEASNDFHAPLGGLGYYRLAENGKLYFAAKSEHYHIPLGHNFPGYDLIENAKKLGIDNATHNNTRGVFIRSAERELIRHANGLSKEDTEAFDQIVASTKPQVLNRVLNVNTGSLACEAGFKLMLSKFYRSENGRPSPEHTGKTPVFLCMSDFEGGRQANYHGTTMTGQFVRGLWPDLYESLEKDGLFKAVGVKINDYEDFEQKFNEYNQGDYRIAGFTSEIILMNYSAIKLKPEYMKACYDLCHKHHVPVMCDEVQSGAWYKELFLFRNYGINPDIVIVGKGFPGGHYSASKMITTAEFDSLSQFGALVTNGQEDLAALAYLITMDYISSNGDEVERLGHYIEAHLKALCAKYPKYIDRFEGYAHLNGIVFHETNDAIQFCKILNDQCIDISAQTYKANCPPTALLKMPVICGEKAIDFFMEKAAAALDSMEK